jgi:hypothetical protein
MTDAKGFVILDYIDRWQASVATLADWVRAGKLRYEEDILEGLETALTRSRVSIAATMTAARRDPRRRGRRYSRLTGEGQGEGACESASGGGAAIRDDRWRGNFGMAPIRPCAAPRRR